MLNLRDIIRKWKSDAKLESAIQFQYKDETIDSDDGSSFQKVKTLKIYTSRPGLLIGYHGWLFYHYAAELIKNNIISAPEDIKIEEVQNIDI